MSKKDKLRLGRERYYELGSNKKDEKFNLQYSTCVTQSQVMESTGKCWKSARLKTAFVREIQQEL